jgi:hydrogenase maturation protein HypF
VRGVVQGVGFRPFVYRLATDRSLAGWVLNSTEGVVIEVEGTPDALAGFGTDLIARKPPLAVIEQVQTTALPPVGHTGFAILASQDQPSGFALVSPDIAICPDCLRELRDPADRRYRYPFINCTHCGPRFTIIRDIPYDRPKTTMAGFPLCPDCEREYHDPADRRFHAQPVACPVCGPKVWLVPTGQPGQAPARRPGQAGAESPPPGAPVGEQALAAARRVLAGGGILAVKGLGGFHLACDAANESALITLRQRKGRIDKPFAVMCRDLVTAESLCLVARGERELMECPQRPIVLLQRQPGAAVSVLAAPGNPTLGLMLPYTPLHHLLFGDDGPAALVMTSGNYSEEPIATDNAEALDRLASLADAFLLHDRPIAMRCDDSVTRLVAGRESLMRRSRGHAPFPVRLPAPGPSVLAVGPELKNTFCLTRDNYAFLSQHIGDLENAETLASFAASVDHFMRLFRVQPEALAHDLHPDYLSTQWAREQTATGGAFAGLPLIAAQHHHAHLAACLADNQHPGPAIGVCWDGTGYGEDGAIWGGEFLVGDAGGFVRAAHLRYVPLPGGAAAIRRPWRMAFSHLANALGAMAWDLDLPFSRHLDPAAVAVVRHQLTTGLNAPPTSSAGRLFDAVAALTGLRGEVSYEGQAAMELEALAASAAPAPAYPVMDEMLPVSMPAGLETGALVRAVAQDVAAGVAAPVIAARFHRTLAELIAAVSGMAARQYGVRTVCLTGGVFQNTLLLGLASALLEQAGLTVLTHHQVPANDGGVSLGQAAIAQRRLSRAAPA